MGRKIPIHFSSEGEAEVKQMGELLGLSGTYGEIPKTLKASVTFAKAYLHWLDKVIPDLEPPDLDLLLSSIKRVKIERWKLQAVQKATREALEVIPTDGGKVA
jgi:23S rRNA A1618 N6-methylase RlmF